MLISIYNNSYKQHEKRFLFTSTNKQEKKKKTIARKKQVKLKIFEQTSRIKCKQEDKGKQSKNKEKT